MSTKWKCPKCGNRIEYRDGKHYGNLIKVADDDQAICMCNTIMEKV